MSEDGVEHDDVEYWSEQAEAALDQMGRDAVTTPRFNADDVAVVLRDVDTREDREDVIHGLEQRGFEVTSDPNESVVFVDASTDRLENEIGGDDLRDDGSGEPEDGVDRSRLPEYGEPQVKRYTLEGLERVKVVRPKTILTSTLTGIGPEEVTTQETLADFPAKHDYDVLRALADDLNVRLEGR